MSRVECYRMVFVRKVCGIVSRIEFEHYIDLDDACDRGINVKLFPGWRVSWCENMNKKGKL